MAQLVGRRRCVVVRQAAQSEEAAGLGPIEVGDVVVVRAVHRRQGLVIGDAAVREEAARDPDDAVDHLRLDAVALLVLAALGGVRGPRLRAGGEARLGQDAAATSTGHARAVHAPRPEHRVAGDPHLAPVALDHLRRAIAPPWTPSAT